MTDSTSLPEAALEAVLRRDRVVVVAALVVVIVLAWAYILLGAGTGMTPFEMTQPFGGPADMDMTMGSAAPMTMDQAGSDMAMGDGMTMAMAPMAWTPGYAVLMFFMWWIMMVAMMLPSASPMILLFARFNRTQRAEGRALRADRRVRARLRAGLGRASARWRSRRNGAWSAAACCPR